MSAPAAAAASSSSSAQPQASRNNIPFVHIDRNTELEFHMTSDEICFDDEDHCDLIGSGKYGDVYRARWTPSEANKAHFEAMGSPAAVAVKVMEVDNKRVLKAFLKDLAIMYKQKHHKESLVLFGADQKDGTAFIVMELMPHGDLSKFVQSPQWEALSMPARWGLLRDMVHTVDILHRDKVRHRDIKPGNFLVYNAGDDKAPKWRIKAADFGLSETLWTSLSTSTNTSKKRKRGEHGGGTDAFMPPECLRLQFQEHHSSMDVFSLGMTLWAVLINNGKPPWGQHFEFAQDAICNNGLRPPLKDAIGMNDIPVEWRDHVIRLIACCWAQKPTDRPTCAQMMSWMDQAADQIAPAAVVQTALDAASIGWTITTRLMDEILRDQPLFTSEQVHQLLALFLYNLSDPGAAAFANQWKLPPISDFPRRRNYWDDGNLTGGLPSRFQRFFEHYYHYITDAELGEHFASALVPTSLMRGRTRELPPHLAVPLPADPSLVRGLPPAEDMPPELPMTATRVYMGDLEDGSHD